MVIDINPVFQSPSGITTLEVYSELFAAYLYQNELYVSVYMAV